MGVQRKISQKHDWQVFYRYFTAVNSLQRIPVIIDNGVRVIESLAILDYLEAKYPTPSLMPRNPECVATVRMVEMLAINELQPAVMQLSRPLVGLDVDNQKLDAAKARVISVIQCDRRLTTPCTPTAER